MAENRFAEVVRKLAGTENRSDTARLRDIFEDVEVALSAGVTHAALVAALNAEGFALSVRSFQSALYRLRAKNTAQQATAPAAPALSQATVQARARPLDTPTTDPTDLDPGAAPLTKKQQRERAADQWIKPAHNPIIDRIIDKESKS